MRRPDLERALDWSQTWQFVQRAALSAAGVLAAAGVWSAFRVSIDAVPDITNPQLQINTAVGALAPEEIETLVTVPIEMEMAGLPDLPESAEPYRVVVQLREKVGASPRNYRINLNLEHCAGCNRAEYACTCDH